LCCVGAAFVGRRRKALSPIGFALEVARWCDVAGLVCLHVEGASTFNLVYIIPDAAMFLGAFQYLFGQLRPIRLGTDRSRRCQRKAGGNKAVYLQVIMN
jgi:hypothetical protein